MVLPVCWSATEVTALWLWFGGCEKIQHYGAMKDETGTQDVEDEALCLENIKKTMVVMKKDYEEVEKWLKDYYGPISE